MKKNGFDTKTPDFIWNKNRLVLEKEAIKRQMLNVINKKPVKKEPEAPASNKAIHVTGPAAQAIHDAFAERDRRPPLEPGRMAILDNQVEIGSKADKVRVTRDKINIVLNRKDKPDIVVQHDVAEFNEVAERLCGTKDICVCCLLTRGDRLAFCNNSKGKGHETDTSRCHMPPNCDQFCKEMYDRRAARLAKSKSKAQN